MYGKHANIYADIPNKALISTDAIKTLTGKDRTSAQFKFKSRFEFVNYAKLIFSANELPAIRDDTDAVWRRIAVIPFTYTVPQDKDDKELVAKLTTEKELSGIFNWALEGLNRVLEKGSFTKETSYEERREQYVEHSDPVQAFVDAAIELDSEGEITKEELYQKFLSFCKQKGLVSKNKIAFGKRLVGILGETIEPSKVSKEGKQKHSWRGIKLKKSQGRLASLDSYTGRSELIGSNR